MVDHASRGLFELREHRAYAIVLACFLLALATDAFYLLWVACEHERSLVGLFGGTLVFAGTVVFASTAALTARERIFCFLIAVGAASGAAINAFAATAAVIAAYRVLSGLADLALTAMLLHEASRQR